MKIPENYEERIKKEADHFFSEAAQLQKSPEKLERGFPIVKAFGHAYQVYTPIFNKKMPHFDIKNYIMNHVNKNGETTLVSLGCGTGDWEIELLKKSENKIKLDLMEVNEDILKYAKEYGKKYGLSFNIIIQDANKISLKKNYYDFILVRSSLHHFIEFEYIFSEINKALKPNGKFLVMGEVIGRNGHLLYDETREVVQKIMDVLPKKFRLNHNTKKIDTNYPSVDYSKDTFEGIRCEEIYSLIQSYFKPVEQITFDAILTFLLDFRYGPNYNLENKLDKSVVEFITNMDMYYIENKILKPTALFGIYERNNN